MKLKTLSLALVLACSTLLAESADDNNMFDIEKTGEWIALPYVFTSDSTGFSGGVGTIAQGVLQPQTTLVATLFYGAEQDIMINGNPDVGNFSGGLLSFSNVKIPYTHRLFFSIWGASMYVPKDSFYIHGDNDSDAEDVWKSPGQSNFFYMTFSYVLPIGEGIDNPDNLFKLRDGFAMDREGYGNGTPFATGRTTVGLKTFYQDQDIENWENSAPWPGFTSKPEWNTEGLRFFLLHDNTDYDLNPSRGYNFQLQYSRDFGEGDNLQSWDFLEFKYNKYFNLDTFSFTQQNVLALSFWTGYSFSWDTENEVYPGIDSHRSPMWEGGRLGGFIRMRGYDNNRFSDKAVIYGTAEYRAMLDWNPFKTTKFLQKYSPVAIDWFQIVPFVEAGRVNDKYNADLLKDLKYDVGISFRAFAAELPVRFDVAYGDEGTNMWVMFQHPFDF